MGIAIALTLFVNLILKLIASDKVIPSTYWEASFSILLVYMLFNAIWSISYEKKSTYMLFSVIGYLALAFVGGYIAQYFSGQTMDEAGSFRWLYIIFSVCYLVILGIVNAMRKILEIVKKQDARLRGEEMNREQ